MMGDGRTVPPRMVNAFCRRIASGCLYGEYSYTEGMQALCIAGFLDGIARGTIDLSKDPDAIVRQIIADINNVTNKPNKITDISRFDEIDERPRS